MSALSLSAFGHSSNNDVIGFNCKLLSKCSDLSAPIITKFANASFHEDDIDLFRSYLSNRKQIVEYHNGISRYV